MELMQENHIKEIYELLQDDISRYIFENRLLYSLTEDSKYMRNIVCTICEGKEIYNFMKQSKKVIGIFGAGEVGKHLVHIYEDIKFECFIDNKKAGTKYEGLSVISLQEYKEKYKDGIIVISTKLYYKEIMDQLMRENIKKENIINIGEEYRKLNNLSYFDLPQLKERKVGKEIFIDCGGYDGSTSVNFINWCENQEGFVYIWEPDPDNQLKCRKLLDSKNICYELISKGVWNEAKELKLIKGGPCSTISDNGDIKIKVDSIDSVIKKTATFIKMDIEGSEFYALLGAKNIISKYKPKLAISIYHKAKDIWELPWLIHRINPEYVFFLRHYSFADNDTVLYAL